MISVITLTRGQKAIVDDEDYGLASQFTWHARIREGKVYQVATQAERRIRSLPRLLLGAPKGMVVDHINGNVLDNRRANLRLATSRQNAHNKMCYNRLGIKGIQQQGNRFCAYINVGGGRNLYLGSYLTPTAAGDAYRTAAIKHFGEFACWDRKRTTANRVSYARMPPRRRRCTNMVSVYRGVSRHNKGQGSKPWRAMLCQKYIGSFTTEAAAARAYDEAAVAKYGEAAAILNFKEEIT